MSKRIEEFVEKVVFDSSEFDKYAKQTMEVLGRFEQQIDGLAKSADLSGLGTNIASGFKDVVSTIDTVGKKYSWLEQIAVGAYRKIGEAATSYIKNKVFDITGLNSAVSGWKKYENEVESVQTIMNATNLGIEDVEKQLKKLGWYTDETSYKYGDMVSNIAKFNAAGITDLEEATNSMIGIANMAGFYGVNATKATGAMEGFAKAMGMGYMDQMSWKRIETAGMNALNIQKAFLDTAVELGKLDKKGDKYVYGKGKAAKEFKASEFKAFLKLKWLDQDVMNTTFRKYSLAVDDIYKAWLDSGETAQVSELIDELGDSLDQTSLRALEASQQARTFTDVVESLQEVVASGWRTSFRYIFGNYEEARDLWKGVVDEFWDIFAGAGYKRNDLLRAWYDEGGRDALLKGIANMWYGLKAIVSPIKDAFDAVFPYTTVEKLLELTKKFQNFSEKFRGLFDFGFLKDKRSEGADDSVKKMTETTETFEDACKRTRKEIDRLYDEVNRGKWGRMEKRWKALGEAGYVWQIVQNEVNKRYNAAGVGTANYGMHKVVNDGTVKLGKKMVEQTSDIASNANIITTEMLDAYKRTWRLENTAKGIFSIVSFGKDVIKEIGLFASDFVGKITAKLLPAFDYILEKTSKWGKAFSAVYEEFKKNDSIHKFFTDLSDSLSDLIALAVNTALPVIGETIGWIIDRIRDIAGVTAKVAVPVAVAIFQIIGQIPGAIKWVYDKLSPIIDSVKTNLWPTIKSIGDWINNTALPFVKILPTTVGAFIKNTYNSGKKLVTDVWNQLIGSEGYRKLKASLEYAWTSIKDFGKKAWTSIKEVGGKISEEYAKFFDAHSKEDGSIDWASVFATAIDWLSGKVADFVTVIGNAAQNLGALFAMFKPGGDSENLILKANSLYDATEGIQDFAINHLEPLKKFFEELLTWLKKIGTMLEDPIEYIVTTIKNFIDNIVGMFKDLNIEKIAGAFKDTGIGLFFGVLAKNMASGALSIASIPTQFAIVLKSLGEVLVSYTRSLNATALMKVAKAIGILTLSIIALTAVPQDKLTDVVSYIALLGLVGALIVRCLAVYEKFKKVRQIQEDTVQSYYMFDFKGSDMATALVQPLKSFLDTLSLGVNQMLKKIGAAIKIVAIAGAVAIIWNTIKDIYDTILKIKLDRSAEASNALVVAVALVAGMVAALFAINRWLGVENNDTIGGALSFITMALAIKIIFGVIEEMSGWGIEKLGKSILGIIPVLLSVVGLAYAASLVQTTFSKFKLKDQNAKTTGKSGTKNPLFAIANMLITFAIALNLMTPALQTISEFGFYDIASIYAVLAGLIGVVWAMTNFAAQLGKSEHLFRGIAAMTALTLMITGLIGVFAVLGVLMQAQGAGSIIGSGLLAFAAGILAIAAAAWALEKLGASQAFDKFANTVSKFGFGIIAAAAAILIFAKALPLIVDGIVAVGKALTDDNTTGYFTAGIIAIGLAILAAWAIVKGDVIKELFSTVKLFVEKFSGFMTQTGFPAILDLLGKFATFFQNNKGKVLFVAFVVLNVIFDVLNGLIPNLIDRLVQFLLIVINSFAKTLLNRTPQLFAAILNVLKVIAVLVAKAIAKVFGGILKFFGVDHVEDYILDFISDFEEGTEKGIDDALADLQKSTDKYEDGVVNTVNGAKKAIKERTSGSTDLSDAFNLTGVTGAVTSVTRGFDLSSILPSGSKETIFGSATEAFSAIPDSIKQNFGVAGMNADEGMAQIVNIMDTQGINIKTSADDTFGYVEQTVTHCVKKIDEDGKETVEELDGAFGEIEVIVPTHMERTSRHTAEARKGLSPDEIEAQMIKEAYERYVNNPTKEALDELPPEMQARAKNAIDGFVNEIKSKRSQDIIWSAGSGVAKRFLTAYDVTTATESPSKEMMWRGLMAVNGLVKGVYDNVKDVATAGTMLATTLLDSVTNKMEENQNISPTITPVLNLNNVNSNIGLASDLFNGYAMSAALASDAVDGFNQNKMFEQTYNETINARNADIVSALGLLRGDVNALNDSFANTQVVLDSGALVGATARQMDNALGRFNVYKQRGI